MQGLKRLEHDIVNSSVVENTDDGVVTVTVDCWSSGGTPSGDGGENFNLYFSGKTIDDLANDASEQYENYDVVDEASKVADRFNFDDDEVEDNLNILLGDGQSIANQIEDIRDMFYGILHNHSYSILHKHSYDRNSTDIYEDLDDMSTDELFDLAREIDCETLLNAIIEWLPADEAHNMLVDICKDFDLDYTGD